MAKRRSSRRRRAVDQSWVKALANELRVEILAILTERIASPKELADELGAKLPSVAYHFTVLRNYGRIELVDEEKRRGAVEHYYRATSSTLLPAREWRGLGGGHRTVVGASLASDLFDGLAAALEAGKLADASSHVARLLLILDAEGHKNVKALTKQFTKAIEKEQAASVKRVAETNGGERRAKAYTVGVLAFEDSRDVSKGSMRSGKSAKTASANGGAATTNGKSTTGKARASRRKPKGTTGAK